MKIINFSFLFSIIFSYFIYEPNSVVLYINNVVLDEYYYRMIKRSLAILFQDAYSFKEIPTNLPQPDFDNN